MKSQISKKNIICLKYFQQHTYTAKTHTLTPVHPHTHNNTLHSHNTSPRTYTTTYNTTSRSNSPHTNTTIYLPTYPQHFLTHLYTYLLANPHPHNTSPRTYTTTYLLNHSQHLSTHLHNNLPTCQSTPPPRTYTTTYQLANPQNLYAPTQQPTNLPTLNTSTHLHNNLPTCQPTTPPRTYTTTYILANQQHIIPPTHSLSDANTRAMEPVLAPVAADHEPVVMGPLTHTPQSFRVVLLYKLLG